jgi:hypothetical protein
MEQGMPALTSRLLRAYTVKNIYGLVPYQSRNLIDKGYTCQWYIMYLYDMQHWWPFCIGFRGQHRAIPDASPRDISYPDPNDDADIDVPDQQA